jgi:integrase/recombinase XerD
MHDLRTAMQEYLDIRRKLGFKLEQPGRLLHQFVFFAEQEGASFITTDLALKWATQPKTSNRIWHAIRLGVVRRFADYRSAMDPRTEIPPQQLLPAHYQRKPPYIYNNHEIMGLIKAAQRLPSKLGLRASTYSTLIGLLAVTGMRMSESIALDRNDVDLTEGILTIRQTKFSKSRLVPIHFSTQEVLQHYAILRDQTCSFLKTPSFFVSENGIRLTHWSVRWNFVRLSRQIGLRDAQDSHGPRLHDLRHSFAVQTLLDWYRSGMDVERHMPKLATYLGHRHVNDTYWYISAVPELLNLATERLDTLPIGALS